MSEPTPDDPYSGLIASNIEIRHEVIREAFQLIAELCDQASRFHPMHPDTLPTILEVMREHKVQAEVAALRALSADTRPAKGLWMQGSYRNVCTQCKREFYGDKHAVECADCAYGHRSKA